jgi:hypothetical protein
MPNKWISQEFHKKSNNYLVCIIMKLFHLPFEVEKWTSLYAIFIGGGKGFIMYFALLVFFSPPFEHIFGEEKLCRYCCTFMFFNPWKHYLMKDSYKNFTFMLQALQFQLLLWQKWR